MPQPCRGSGENSGTGQDGSRDQLPSSLASTLAADEKRLREMVAEYDLDPEKILRESLDDVKEVITRIYGRLREDAESPDGVLAKKADIWDSLNREHKQTTAATGKLRPIFERFNRLNSDPEQRSTAAELDDTSEKMIDRRQQWLAKITEFQQVFSAFYNELARGEQHPD